MALYFLHLQNRTGSIRDEEGMNLPDLGAARQSAIDAIRSILSDEVRIGRLDLKGHVDIVDEAGTLLAVVPFSEALDARLDGAE